MTGIGVNPVLIEVLLDMIYVLMIGIGDDCLYRVGLATSDINISDGDDFNDLDYC